MTLYLVPLSLAQANEHVAAWHRHARPVVGAKFSIGAADAENVLRAVAIVGRPVARHFDDGLTLEVNRVASDGTRNTNSFLYGACARAAFALGYRRLVTYTLVGETGASLRGAGWTVIASRPARPGWSAPSRPRDNSGRRSRDPFTGREPADRGGGVSVRLEQLLAGQTAGMWTPVNRGAFGRMTTIQSRSAEPSLALLTPTRCAPSGAQT